MTNLRKEQMGVGRGILATRINKCWTSNPEGPFSVSLGIDHRTDKMLKSSCSTRLCSVGSRNYCSWGVWLTTAAMCCDF